MSNSSSGGGGAVEAEYNEINQRNGWHLLFQEIREKTDKEAKEKHFSISEARKSNNTSLNRYRDVNPYDHSRIILHRGSVDYINANLVKMEKAGRKYILTQGPLKETAGHFWLMIWENNSKAILMLNKLVEKEQVKCYQYWPEKFCASGVKQFPEVGLTVEMLKVEEYANYLKRTFKLTDIESNTSREIIQFHYTTWPDFGIPSSPVTFLQFLKKVRDSGALEAEVGPAVVHCSAGIGRSGTFCLVDCCLVLIDKEGENKVSVRDVLYELRKYRMGLIQTSDQLFFSYQSIIEGKKLLKDASFLEYDEVPSKIRDETTPEETPPPLPPRSHSLHQAGVAVNNKPLPVIPNSESFNEDFMTSANHAATDKDAINNFINIEKKLSVKSNNGGSGSIHINRPLPPIPTQKQNSLDKVDESESDEDEYEVEEEEDDEEKYENDIDDNEDMEVVNNDNNSSNACSEGAAEADVAAAANRNEEAGSPNELKRRRRMERQADIEQKVNEIKRKQRESEEGAKISKKRRRSKKCK